MYPIKIARLGNVTSLLKNVRSVALWPKQAAELALADRIRKLTGNNETNYLKQDLGQHNSPSGVKEQLTRAESGKFEQNSLDQVSEPRTARDLSHSTAHSTTAVFTIV